MNRLSTRKEKKLWAHKISSDEKIKRTKKNFRILVTSGEWFSHPAILITVCSLSHRRQPPSIRQYQTHVTPSSSAYFSSTTSVTLVELPAAIIAVRDRLNWKINSPSKVPMRGWVSRGFHYFLQRVVGLMIFTSKPTAEWSHLRWRVASGFPPKMRIPFFFQPSSNPMSAWWNPNGARLIWTRGVSVSKLWMESCLDLADPLFGCD